MLTSDVSDQGAPDSRNSLVRPVKTSNTRVSLSFRATECRIAVLALSAACTSSTTSITGLSAAAAVTVLRNASAILSGINSGDHSTGFGTPGNALRISELILGTSLNASGSALPLA